MDGFSARRGSKDIKQGRRANINQNSTAFDELTQDDIPNGIGAQDIRQSIQSSPRPTRRQGGWAEDFKDRRKGETEEEFEDRKKKEKDEEVDERLRPDATINLQEDTDDIPVIPDLDDVQEDDLAQQIAAPPSVQVTRVATYKELDTDFQKHAGLLTLDGEIDLKILGTVLSPESEVFEEDKVWEWVRVFTEVASELQTEWDLNNPEEVTD